MKQTKRFRQILQGKEIIVAPGAADCLVAKVIEKAAFPAVYLTGAGVSYTCLGLPDVGLVTMSEMVMRAEQICSSIAIPVIADGDTGYGNALNVQRTVRAYEQAGVAAIQLEDQVFPKRCGHMSGKQLISEQEMVGKLKAAVDARVDEDFVIIARTDARMVDGLEHALERARAYQEAGADVIFVEGPESPEELKKIAATISLPTLANMVEGGRTPLLTTKELADMGFKIVIYPNAAIRVISKALLGLMKEIAEQGTTKGYLDNMLMFGEFNELLGLKELREKESRYAV